MSLPPYPPLVLNNNIMYIFFFLFLIHLLCVELESALIKGFEKKENVNIFNVIFFSLLFFFFFSFNEMKFEKVYIETKLGNNQKKKK
jgi:hypothetical protein